MSERRHSRVVNVDEVEPKPSEKGTRFGATRRHLGIATGATGLGCTHYEVPPGRTAFPHHFHCLNDEAIYILEGEGTLRLGDERIAVRPGDYVTIPPGPATAHQLENSGARPLRYLCFSTLKSADIVGYPDSKKLAAMAGESYASVLKGQTWARLVVRE
ncbi:MAG TPA: cupin domain-containing protein, partial [Polyangia bacterium]